MRRLSVVDGIFLRTHRGMGTPIALQGLWRTAAAVDRGSLDRLHASLRTGPLGRRVVRSRIPGARDRWQINDRAHPVDIAAAEVSPEEIPAWAGRCGADLDPLRGPGWRLSAAPLTDGGTIIALTCSHVLADARGLIIAAEQAMRSPGTGSYPATASEPYRDDPPPPLSRRAPDSDWADAAHTWATVLGGTARAARRRAGRASAKTSRVARAGSGFRPHAAADTPEAELPVPGVILRCPAADWERVASGCGGTANSLFIWFVANALWTAGFPEHRIAASLPVDTRAEPRVDNDLAMTEIAISPADGPAAVRAKSRAAYERRMSSPAGLPEEFLHLVPDRLAYRLSRGAGERDILCSNIGVIPPVLHTFGPYDCTGTATRAIHPGLTYAGRPRTRMSGYLCRFRDDYILTLMSLAPEHVAGPAELHRIAAHTAQRVGLPLVPW
ncbi:hypothetical protein [Nocardia sp. X0981]